MKNNCFKIVLLYLLFTVSLQNAGFSQTVRNSSDSVFIQDVMKVLKDSISKSAFDSLDFSKPNILVDENRKPMVVTFPFRNNSAPDSCVIIGIKGGVFTGNWLKSKHDKHNTGYIFTSSFDGRKQSAVWFREGKNLKAIRRENGKEQVLFDHSRAE